MSLPSAVRRSCIVMTTPTICSAGFARARTLSTVSSKSSVPSRAKYDDWMGISRWLDATRALTVSRPSVGGQSITTYSNSSRTASSRSFRRKCASNSPTSLASSLARLMRAGARNRCGCAVGTMMSLSEQLGSTKASKTFFVSVRGSMNVSELLPCGSRSIRSVGLPRRARAAARLMAVVVLPTPPFWFAIETIIGDADCKHRRRCRQGDLRNPLFWAGSAAGLGAAAACRATSCTCPCRRDRGSRATSGAARSRLQRPAARPAWPGR